MSIINHSVESSGRRKELLTGVVVLDSAGTAIFSQVCGGFTVARSAAGRFVATIGKKYSTIEYGHCVPEIHATNQAVAAKGVVAVLRSVSASGKAATFQLLTPPLAAGAGVDVDAEANTILRFVIVATRGAL